MLVAIIGGSVALRTNGHGLQVGQRIPISIAVLILTVYTYLWIQYNDAEAHHVANRLSEEIGWRVRGQKPGPGYRGAVVLLAIVALLSMWLPF